MVVLLVTTNPRVLLPNEQIAISDRAQDGLKKMKKTKTNCHHTQTYNLNKQNLLFCAYN